MNVIFRVGLFLCREPVIGVMLSVEYGVTANITAFHAVARGSIPRTRTMI